MYTYATYSKYSPRTRHCSVLISFACTGMSGPIHSYVVAAMAYVPSYDGILTGHDVVVLGMMLTRNEDH